MHSIGQQMNILLSSWVWMPTHTNKTLGMHSIGQQVNIFILSWNTSTNQTFGMHSIDQQMKVIRSYLKSQHLNKSSPWSAFNWSLDEGNSFNSEHPHKSTLWGAFNWQQMKVVFQVETPLENKLLECIQLANRQRQFFQVKTP